MSPVNIHGYVEMRKYGRWKMEDGLGSNCLVADDDL
jgi:hypothetical protein